ncbi:Lrp/AsnC family transcriptional regulator [Rapidithrix thailandica]|uniref:Lrp/AsnC family transcriptional regulator n=1 Tax=Rapidithrix thailandica TaxID=413964 RepID=A0AAW9S1Y6_9BACT
MENLDLIDRKILGLLQNNARITMKEIAAATGISTTPAYERVKRMERQGIIKGYVTLLDKERINRQLTVFCQVTLKSHSKPDIVKFEKHIFQFSEIMECYHTAGSFDYLLKIMVADMDAYQKFIMEKLAETEAMAHFQSVFVMGDVKVETAFAMSE